jgi:processive 1,2-diacylglycerol beta-glucosyltransferase
MVVSCGRNERLREQVARLPARMRLRAIGFVDGVADLMRSADLLVTKAGGLTLAEAFCCGVPVVVYDILPGQEAGNLDFVLAQQAVLYAPSPAHLPSIVADLHADPERRARLAEQGRRLAQPLAAERIARGLLDRLDASRA